MAKQKMNCWVKITHIDIINNGLRITNGIPYFRDDGKNCPVYISISDPLKYWIRQQGEDDDRLG
jgi:hypothetical protein